MPNYKLTYFDARGRAEIARLLFAAAGVKYEDVRITREQWPALKEKTSLGQLPTLEVDGKQFGQSLAIASYLAREFGFYGKDNLEAFAIDQVVQLVADFMASGVKLFFERDEAKKAELQKIYVEETIPKYLGLFKKLLKESGSGYFVGKSLTFADIAVYDFMTSLLKRHPEVLDNFPEVKTLVDTVSSNEKIKAYVENRKETEF